MAILFKKVRKAQAGMQLSINQTADFLRNAYEAKRRNQEQLDNNPLFQSEIVGFNSEGYPINKFKNVVTADQGHVSKKSLTAANPYKANQFGQMANKMAEIMNVPPVEKMMSWKPNKDFVNKYLGMGKNLIGTAPGSMVVGMLKRDANDSGIPVTMEQYKKLRNTIPALLDDVSGWRNIGNYLDESVAY